MLALKQFSLSGLFIAKHIYANPCFRASDLWFKEVFCLSEHGLVTKKEQEVGINCLCLSISTITEQQLAVDHACSLTTYVCGEETSDKYNV